MNRRAVIKIASVVGLAAPGTGCEWPWERAEAPSRIVERVERAGAGDVRHASDLALGQWFSAHADLAVEINRMCVRRPPDSVTPGPTEARVCAAAAPAAFFHYVPSGEGGGLLVGPHKSYSADRSR
jgi:hypothetical protein